MSLRIVVTAPADIRPNVVSGVPRCVATCPSYADHRENFCLRGGHVAPADGFSACVPAIKEATKGGVEWQVDP